MRRFEFSLEKVLELRQYAERESEMKLAEVTGRIVGAEQEMEQLRSARDEVGSVAVHPGRVDMSALSGRAGYRALLDRRSTELRGRIARLESERETARQEYLRSSRARKAISQLRERREQEYYKLARKEEIKELDEIGVTLAFGRLQEERDV